MGQSIGVNFINDRQMIGDIISKELLIACITFVREIRPVGIKIGAKFLVDGIADKTTCA